MWGFPKGLAFYLAGWCDEIFYYSQSSPFPDSRPFSMWLCSSCHWNSTLNHLLVLGLARWLALIQGILAGVTWAERGLKCACEILFSCALSPWGELALGSHSCKESKTCVEQTCNLEPNLASLDELNSSQPTFTRRRNKHLLSCGILHLVVTQIFYSSRVIRIIVHLFNILDLNLSIVLWESKEKSHPLCHSYKYWYTKNKSVITHLYNSTSI